MLIDIAGGKGLNEESRKIVDILDLLKNIVNESGDITFTDSSGAILKIGLDSRGHITLVMRDADSVVSINQSSIELVNISEENPLGINITPDDIQIDTGDGVLSVVEKMSGGGLDITEKCAFSSSGNYLYIDMPFTATSTGIFYICGQIGGTASYILAEGRYATQYSNQNKMLFGEGANIDNTSSGVTLNAKRVSIKCIGQTPDGSVGNIQVKFIGIL